MMEILKKERKIWPLDISCRENSLKNKRWVQGKVRRKKTTGLEQVCIMSHEIVLGWFRYPPPPY